MLTKITKTGTFVPIDNPVNEWSLASVLITKMIFGCSDDSRR
jgi:hypothetical protein